MSVKTVKVCPRAAEKQRQEAERERRRVASVNSYKASMIFELRNDIDEIEDKKIKAALNSELDVLATSLSVDSQAVKWRGISDVRGTTDSIRRRLREAQIDMGRERRLKLKVADAMDKAESGVFDKLPGLQKYYDSIKSDISKAQSDIDVQEDRIAALLGLERDLNALITRAGYASMIDTSGMQEDRLDLEEFIMTIEKQRAAETTKLRNEIDSYFQYLKDVGEAASVQKYYDEAVGADNVGYLQNLKTRVYRVYIDIKRALERTRFFRQELSDSLLILREMEAAMPLIEEIQQTINPQIYKYLSQDQYFELHKKTVNFLARGKEEAGLFSKVAAVTVETLTSLGYHVIEDDPKTPLISGKTRYFDAPSDDYRVAVNIDEDGIVSCRALRLLDDEQNVAVESDVDVVKKLCGHLEILHGAYEESGFELEILRREEPNEAVVLEKQTDQKKAAMKRHKRKIKSEEQHKLLRNRLA